MDRFREADLSSSCPGYDDSLWMMYQDQDEANTLLDDAGVRKMWMETENARCRMEANLPTG